LLRMMSAFDGQEVIYASTIPSLRSEVPGNTFYSVPDANRRRPIALMYLILKMMWIMLRQRPDVVISTGAAPGYIGLVFGKLFRAQTIWVDSIANVDKLSMSGRLAGKLADLWLTQWPHLAKNHGPHFVGAVI
jgi:UDP-N-acetylglucosamine:LPS N-acetylglucosamine transferase